MFNACWWMLEALRAILIIRYNKRIFIMGYGTRPEMVRVHKKLLLSILFAVENDQVLLFDVEEGANISTEQYNLRRILAAADRHKEEENGMFVGLSGKVRVRVLFEEMKLSVEPKNEVQRGSVVRIRQTVLTEADITAFLQDSSSTIEVVEFTPTSYFDEGEFSAALLTIGWKLYPATKTENEGKVSYAVERTTETEKEESPFDRLRDAPRA